MSAPQNNRLLIAAAVLFFALIAVFHLLSAKAGHSHYRDQHIGTALEYAKGRIDLLHPVIVGFAHTDGNRPAQTPNAMGAAGVPQPANAAQVAGELILTHAAGSVIRLCADGSIYSRGNWNHDGGLRVNGNIYAELNITARLDVLDQLGAHGTVNYLRTQYDAHGHPYNAGPTPSTTSTTDHPA